MTTMQRVRVYRVNGDSLSCWFSPSGALSNARLTVGAECFEVSSQLPGLTVGVEDEYLAELGYVRWHDPVNIKLGSAVNKLLEGTDLFVEAVCRRSGYTAYSVCLATDRYRACCRRSFAAIWNSQSKKMRFEAVRSSALTVVFLSRICLLS